MNQVIDQGTDRDMGRAVVQVMVLGMGQDIGRFMIQFMGRVTS